MAGIERRGIFDSGSEKKRPFVTGGVLAEEKPAYNQANYQTELNGFLSSLQPQEIQVAIGFLGEQIKQKETNYQEAINPYRENWRRLGEEEVRLRREREELRGRIVRGEKTRGPTGGDFREEVKIVLGRMQVGLWKWRKRPPNFLTKVLGRVFSFWARPIHPLIAQKDREQKRAVGAKMNAQESLDFLARQYHQEVADLTLAKQEKEQRLNELLDNWALGNYRRFIFYLAENPRKIPSLLEVYLRQAISAPKEEEILAYLDWNLQAGFSLSPSGKDFNRWLQNFLPQRRQEEWEKLLIGDKEELSHALGENLGNFGAFLSFNSRARQDFRQFLRWRLGEDLRRANVDLENPLPHPYFFLTESPKSQPSSSLRETGEAPVGVNNWRKNDEW